MAENKEELKSLLMKVKVEMLAQKSTFKHEDHGIQSYHFMANRWEKMETVTNFIFLGSKITADDDCSREMKSHLLLGRKL